MKRLLLLSCIVAAIILFFALDLGRYLTLTSLKEHRQELLAYYRYHPFTVVGIFFAAYVVQTTLSLPGAAVLSLAAGAVFGVGMGTIYVNIAATFGATLAFLITRYLLADFIRAHFGPRLEKIDRELEHRGFNYLLFLRLVPLFPFFAVNLAAALTSLPLRTYFLATLVGIVPGSFVFCNAGASLASIQTTAEIASPRVLAAFALLGLSALAPLLSRRMGKRP